MDYNNIRTKSYRSNSLTGTSQTVTFDCEELLSDCFVTASVVGRGNTTGTCKIEISSDNTNWTPIWIGDLEQNTYSTANVISATYINEIQNMRYIRCGWTTKGSLNPGSICIGVWY